MLLIYDGKCGFCGIWVRYFQRLTGERVQYAPSQEVGLQHPEISAEEFKRSVWLIRPDGSRTNGANAVFELVAQARGREWPLWLYRNVPGCSAVSEAAYRFIAGHRNFFYWLTRILWGKEIYPASYRVTRSVILKGMAIVFLIAFLSLLPQISGLIGQNGILPAGEYLNSVRANTGIERYWLLPTLAWLHPSDTFLHALGWTGVGLSVLLLFDVAPTASLLGLFFIYLSFMSIGQDFLSFQWDALLLESGFAATLLARRADSPGWIGIWVLRLLIFRLMLESGLVKLLSGDASWRSLTAMNFHYYTQPLPTPLPWYAQQLPTWLQKFSTGAVFAVELVIPFLFLMPRRFRIAGAWITIVFQLLIAATGNYTFFNLLTIILCVSLLDDRHFRRASSPERRAGGRTAIAIGSMLILVGFLKLAITVDWVPRDTFALVLEPEEILHLVNGYGLFAVMTTSRPEIVIEGSNDGETWQPYAFKYKAGDLHQAPRWVAPYQPRLDWQMWFAALSRYRQTPWFTQLMKRLLEGSPAVLSLLERNPFPDQPPQFIRATMYDYTFTTAAERRATGNWWSRTNARPYFPAVRLK